MKSFTYPITDILGKGLRPTKRNPRNQPYLVQSVGAVPRDKILQAVDEFSLLDVSSLGVLTFPYPQIFVLRNLILVCVNDEIYELSGGVLTSLISGLSVGQRWSCVDYYNSIGLTNGRVTVTRSPIDGVWSVNTSVPFGTSVCDFNGQVFVSSPNVNAVGVI